MNKELYIKREKQLKKLNNIEIMINNLETFLIKNEKNFKRKESIEALNNIKKYLELKKIECKKSYNILKNIEKELVSTCSHEVSIKRFQPQYHCIICNHEVSDSIISIDLSNDYNAYGFIEKTLQDVVYSNKDLIKTISETIEEIQFDRKIKVYRR